MIEDRDAGSLEKNGRSRAREKWLDSKHTLKTEAPEFANGGHVQYEGKREISLRIWPEHLKG